MIILFSALIFAAVLVILNSVVFSVREVRADCYNLSAKDPETEQLADKVIEASNIKLYKNIITLNEKKAAKNINAKMDSEVKVINIERKFPNTVWIHFVKLVPVLAIETNDGSFITCDNNLMIIETGKSGNDLRFNSTVEELEKDRNGAVVRVRLSGNAVNPAKSKTAVLSNPDAFSALRTVVDTVNRLSYEEYDFVRLLSEIDMTDFSRAAAPVIKLEMRESKNRKITFKIQSPQKRLLEKVQHSISAYEQYVKDKLTFKDMEWTVATNSKNEIMVYAN